MSAATPIGEFPVSPLGGMIKPGSITKLRIKLLEVKSTANQKTIAMACGMHPTRLAEYANGKRAIPVHHLTALCSYFECSPYDLLGEAEETEFDGH